MSTLIKSKYADITPILPEHSLPWLKKLKENALIKFSNNGFPSTNEEEWRFTNVSAIEKKLFKPVTTNKKNKFNKIEQYSLDNCWRLALVNGHVDASLSYLEGLPKDVSILSLNEALTLHPEQVRKYLDTIASKENNSFIDFNGACFSDGLYLSVASNTVMSKPLQILHIVTQAEILVATRNLIIAGANTKLNLIESYFSIDDYSYLTNSINEVFVGDNAQVKLYKLQREATKAYHFGGIYVQQKNNSKFSQHNFALGSLLARNEVHTHLSLASKCDLNGLYVGNKRQHIDNHTRINHQQAHAISRETYKAILDQRARGVFQGRVVVCKDAQKTDSQMNNHNLLLSDQAEADSKPQLEIYADDVKCTHGVTIGQLDEKSIFYLKSRCINEQTARDMLTFAFANEMVNKIDITSFRNQVLALLLMHFPQTSIDKNWL